MKSNRRLLIEFIDCTFSATITQAFSLNVKVIVGKYLKPGEIDLALVEVK